MNTRPYTASNGKPIAVGEIMAPVERSTTGGNLRDMEHATLLKKVDMTAKPEALRPIKRAFVLRVRATTAQDVSWH